MKKASGEIFEKNKEVLDVLTSHPRFLSDVKKVRSWMEIPEGGFVDTKAFESWYEDLLNDENRFKEYREYLSKMVSEFKLASNFIYSMEVFLLHNEIIVPDNVSISLDFNRRLGQKELKVQVFGETREEDWRHVWHQVKKLQRHLPAYNPGRFRTKTNLLAEKMAYEMAMSGKNYTSISEALSNAGYGMYGDIEKLVSNFKARFKRFDS